LNCAYRIRCGWRAASLRIRSDLEDQARPVGVADVDALAVANVDHSCPSPVDERALLRSVVNRQPPALIEAQQQMHAGDLGVRDAHVGAQVTPDDDIVTCSEGTF
jgi:hypothetical protein